MEEGESPVMRWLDLDNDILVKILQSSNLFELSAGLAHVFIARGVGLFPSSSLADAGLVGVHGLNAVLCLLSIEEPADDIKKIARSCENISELKIMGPCDMLFASTLVSFLPNLEVLSVRCTVLSIPALVIILEGLKKLKVINISHCVITEEPPLAPMKILTDLDESILEKASRLDKFLTCMSDLCIRCQRTRNDEGFMRWYKYEDLWKVDEVKSLAI